MVSVLLSWDPTPMRLDNLVPEPDRGPPHRNMWGGLPFTVRFRDGLNVHSPFFSKSLANFTQRSHGAPCWIDQVKSKPSFSLLPMNLD